MKDGCLMGRGECAGQRSKVKKPRVMVRAVTIHDSDLLKKMACCPATYLQEIG